MRRNHISLRAALFALSFLAFANCVWCAGTCDVELSLQPEPPTSAKFAAGSVPGGRKFLEGLPGFTRSHVEKDHALITPESRVWFTPPGWKDALAAFLITPASGAHFVMLLADLKAGASVSAPPSAVQRFAYVIEGKITVGSKNSKAKAVSQGGYFYAPSQSDNWIKSDAGALLVIFEKKYSFNFDLENLKLEPEFFTGVVDEVSVLDVPGEVFALRKLIPMSMQYDFNIHIMDFQPGEFLNVKEVHYNQHGLLLLEGQGIYRLADKWYPVEAGDAIWMAPFVPQWYGALGTTRSRYLLYKDNNRDPNV